MSIAAGAIGAAILCLVIILGIGASMTAPPVRNSGQPNAAAGVTVEPLPGFSLNIHPVDLQTMPGGAVAALMLEAVSAVPLDRVSLELTLPGRAIFTDGSQRKSWNIDLIAGRPARIPVELLIQGRGSIIVAAEMLGTVSGRPMRRGTAHELVVGPAAKRSRVNDGAIQFQGRRTSPGGQR